jgi:arginyl-tRNA synthetase
MKKAIHALIKKSLEQLKEQAVIVDLPEAIGVERTRNKTHGDFASNIALILSKQAKMNPRALAEKIIAVLPSDDSLIQKAEIAGPGFINFFLVHDAQFAVIGQIINEKARFGFCDKGKGKKVQVEFVSANPTGPLHVGHGRGAAYGAAVSDVLSAVGYEVHREYYVNDAGRQMHILATSVWLRYLTLCGETLTFPKNGYRGDYIIDVAKTIKQQFDQALCRPVSVIFSGLPQDENEDGEGDKDAYIDALIRKAQLLLGDQYQAIFDTSVSAILADIRDDLSEFGVHFQAWFSEKELMNSGAVQHGLDELTKRGYTYEKNGALWFKSTELGDEKDRVLKRDDGRTTYFASDVAYHVNKVERGFDRIIDIFGADHHGYIARVRASMMAMGVADNDFQVALVQFAILYRDGVKVPMSTRSGSFVTLRELREEIGNDAARFFYVMRKADQHMDFDLALAKSTSNENPIYYIQYAYARICSVMRQLAQQGKTYDPEAGLAALSLLTSDYESTLVALLAKYPDVVLLAADYLEPHLVANYLRELANAFHTYYNAEQFIVDDQALCSARLCLMNAVGQVLLNGLALLGVSAPEKM